MRRHNAYRAFVLLALAAAALTASRSAPGSPENPWVVTAQAPRILPKPSLHAAASPAVALLRHEGDAAPMRGAAERQDAGSTGPSWQGVDSSVLATAGSAGAIGPHGYLQLVNGGYGLYDRSGAVVTTGTLADLAPPDAPAGGHGGLLAEPQALWDAATGRFYYAFLDLDPHFASATGRSYVVFGFSKDDSPTGPSSFCTYYLDYHYEHLDGLPDGDAVYPDSPRLGQTQHFLLLGADVFDWTNGSFFGSDVDWVEKPPPGATCPPASSFDGHMEAHPGVQDANGSDIVSPVPAVQVDPSATGWVVAAQSAATGGSPAQLYALKVVDSAPADPNDFIPTFPSVSAVTVPQFSAPPTAPQPGSTQTIDTLEGQLGNAVSATDPTRGGGVQAIWTQHTVASPTAGAPSQVRWYELDPAKKTVLQSGAAAPPGLFAFNGAIAPDRRFVDDTHNGFGADMALGFDTSSATSPLTVQWVSKEGTGAQSPATPVVPSTDPVAGVSCDLVGATCLWGGAAASSDPASDATAATGQVWLTNAWAAGGAPTTANWRTQNFAVHVPLTVPAITSFSPTSGPVGTSVTVSGSRFLGVTQVTIGGVPTTPTSVTATQIRAPVPPGALTDFVTVTNDGGTAQSPTKFKVTPKIASFSPASLRIGETVTVDGTNLTDTDAVLKVGSVKVTPDGGATSTHLTFPVPATAVTGKLSITTPSGSFTAIGNLGVRPTITSPFNPSHGPVGTIVPITGATLTGITAVKFSGVGGHGTVPATFTTKGGALSATVPTAAITGPVTVTNAGGSTESDDAFAVDPQLAAKNPMSPTSGPVGTTVGFTGSGWAPDAVATFQGYAGPIAVPRVAGSANLVKFLVPDGAMTGPVDLATGGNHVTGPTFKVTPRVTSFSPTQAQVGDTITVHGANLEAPVSIKVGSVQATDVTPTDLPRELTFTVPPGAVTGAIAVTAANGPFTTGTPLRVRPTIGGAFTPANAVTGKTVTIPGTTFAGTTGVKFTGYSGGDPSVPATFKLTGGTLTATVPGAAVSGKVSVTNAGGTTISGGSFVVDPTLTSVAPASAGVGSTIALNGSGLSVVQSATFPGAPPVTTFEAGSTANTLRVRVPDGATSGNVVVATSPSGVTASIPFKVAPRIDSAPSSVVVGDHVTVTGKNFDGLAAGGLKLGSLVLTLVNAGPTSVEFDVPPAAATGTLSLTTPNGTATKSMEVRPQITGVTGAPAAAGQTVTIAGTGLNGVKSVQFTGPNATFVGAPFATTGGLKATVPAGAVTGPIRVTTAAPTPALSASVVVLPKITSFTPTSGPAGGAALVTVNGSGFQQNAALRFASNVDADSLTWVSATKLTARVPSGAVTGKLTVANPDGSAQSASSFTVSLSVVSFTPTTAPVGTQVAITGAGFTAATKVFFGGTAPAMQATVGSPVTPTTLNVTVPAGGATGPITVRNGSTTSSSRTAFTVQSLGAPDPAHGPTGTVVHLTGSGLDPGETVTFDGTAVTADVTATTVAFTVPDGVPHNSATRGVAEIAVGSLKAAGTFTVDLGVDGVTPSHAHPGDQVAIGGIGFGTSDAPNVTDVKFGGVSAQTVTVGAGDALTAVVPAGAVTGPVTVSAGTHTARSAGAFTVDPPVVTGIDPAEGGAGTQVTLAGSGFVTGDSLTFAGVPVAPTGVTATTLSFTVPDGVVPPADSAGNHDAVVAVANPGDAAHPATTTFRLTGVDAWAADPLLLG